MSDHREMREALGAYVLGALEPEERRRVDEHVATCSECRDELARLSPLPALLDRLSRDEAADDRLVAPPNLAVTVTRTALAEQIRLRRQVVAWRVTTGAAAAAAVALLFAWGPWRSSGPADRWVFEPTVATAEVDGTAAALAWEWGTTVELELQDLPPAERYVAWAVSADGRREQAGTWGPTASGNARVRGASAIQRSELRQIAVESDDGELLAVFEVVPPDA